MSQEPDNRQSKTYQFPSDIPYDRLRTGQAQPLDPQPYHEMQLPNPLDPIGRINSEGRAMRNVAQGRMPTWMLLLGWATIGLCSFLVLGAGLKGIFDMVSAAITDQNPSGLLSALPMLLTLIMPTLLLLILIRATRHKLK